MSGLADNPSWEGERGVMTKPRYESSTLSNVKNLVGAEKASSVIRKLWPNLFWLANKLLNDQMVESNASARGSAYAKGRIKVRENTGF